MTAAAAVSPATSGGFSLERRLMLRLGGLYVITLLIVTAIYGVLAWSFRHIEVASDVDQAAIALADTVHIGRDGTRVLDIPADLRSRIDRFGDLGFAVVDRGTGREIAGSTMPASPWEAMNARPPAGFDGDYFLRDRDGNTFYSAVRAIDTPAGRFAVEFRHRSKSATEAREWIWDELGNEAFPVLLPLTAATLLIAWLTLRSSLRPLRRVAEEAEGITRGFTGRRLGWDALPREIRPVVTAANGALDRVEMALREQQRLMANIAHELRTPLAILRARIESLTDRAARRSLLTDFDRVSNLVDRLLAVARLQSEHVAFDTRYELVRVNSRIARDHRAARDRPAKGRRAVGGRCPDFRSRQSAGARRRRAKPCR